MEKKHPVLVEILLKDNRQFFYLNNKDVSAYVYEKEILIQDGV